MTGKNGNLGGGGIIFKIFVQYNLTRVPAVLDVINKTKYQRDPIMEVSLLLIVKFLNMGECMYTSKPIIFLSSIRYMNNNKKIYIIPYVLH